jgi:hypothetical protein
MIVSWKLESRKYLRDNKLLSSSNSKLDRWIMFFMLHRFIEIINDLEFSHRFIALNNFSIPGGNSDKPQKSYHQNKLLSSSNSKFDRLIMFLIWVWTRLPNFYTASMGPLVRVMYRGLTQSVFRLDRVKSSSCDCPAKIPVYSNARCFTSFSSGSSSPEVAEFCPTLRLVYFTARA